ncbi:hypothetical protein RB195_011696 [Necator americanus]|uniref:Uncharacterized protein n=1 Tax=Necator americanus TaxID=51031 RepID=A0ABR1D3S7_NECAM
MHQSIAAKNWRHCSDAREITGQWKIGRITLSSDNFRRVAVIMSPLGRTMTRPINMQWKLGIEDNQEGTKRDPREEELSKLCPPQNQHSMMRRSKTSKNNIRNFLALALVLFNDLSVDSRCIAEINTPKTIIYATNCVVKRIATEKFNENGKGQLCWFSLYCPIGSIRATLALQHDQGICGTQC